MKKLFLFFSVISLSLLMNSCLGEGNNAFSDAAISYITTDNASGLTYAKTITGKYITSNEIKMMYPGSFHVIAYSWDESYGTVPINNGNNIVYNHNCPNKKIESFL